MQVDIPLTDVVLPLHLDNLLPTLLHLVEKSRFVLLSCFVHMQYLILVFNS